MIGLQTTIENLAGRIAADNGGKVTPWQLLPFLPLSLGRIERGMDAMVDEARISIEYESGIKVYEFADPMPVSPAGESEWKSCICCGRPVQDEETGAFCLDCNQALWADICREAEVEDWAEEALWQHEMLFKIARLDGPLTEESLAPHTAMTLVQTRQCLKKLAARAYIRYELDFERNLAYYATRGSVDYTLAGLQRNLQAIGNLPAPMEDAVEERVAHALKALIVVVCVTFFLAFVPWIPPHLPFMAAPFAVGFIVVRSICHGRRVQSTRLQRVQRLREHGPQKV